MDFINKDILFPSWFMDIRYNSKVIPNGVIHDIILSGANCQVYAYEILRYNGLFVPDFRSSELWNDSTYSDMILSEYKPLDILFFNRSNNSWGAHLGVYIGDGKILHNSKDIGVPAIFDIGDFSKIDKYLFLLGGKRFKKIIEPSYDK